jgi:hypothetical protein
VKPSRSFIAELAAVALLLGACGSHQNPPVPTSTQSSSRPTSAAPSATAPQLPPPPDTFLATSKDGSVACPSSDGSCSQTDLAWNSTADARTWFRIYEASYGLDPNGTCAGVQADAQVAMDTKPAARSAQLFEPMAVGGGSPCLWIAAVNDAGESTQIPAAGQ